MENEFEQEYDKYVSKKTPLTKYFSKGIAALTKNELPKFLSVLRDYYNQVDHTMSSLEVYYSSSIQRFSSSIVFLYKSIGLVAKLSKIIALLGIKLLMFPKLFSRYIEALYSLLPIFTNLSRQVSSYNITTDEGIKIILDNIIKPTGFFSLLLTKVKKFADEEKLTDIKLFENINENDFSFSSKELDKTEVRYIKSYLDEYDKERKALIKLFENYSKVVNDLKNKFRSDKNLNLEDLIMKDYMFITDEDPSLIYSKILSSWPSSKDMEKRFKNVNSDKDVDEILSELFNHPQDKDEL